jgi:hypothetical protein
VLAQAILDARAGDDRAARWVVDPASVAWWCGVAGLDPVRFASRAQAALQRPRGRLRWKAEGGGLIDAAKIATNRDLRFPRGLESGGYGSVVAHPL